MRNNDEIVAYVDNLRKSQNMSLNELARATGLAKSSLSRYFNKSRDFPVNKVHLFAKALHTSSEDILGFKPVHYPTSSTDYQSVQADKSTYVVKHDYPSNSIDTSGMHYVRVPIVGTIACGTAITAEQNIEGYTHELFESEPAKGELFALRCQGDSMEPLIPDGALVLIHKQPTVEDDEIAAVQVDDDTRATLKKVKHVGKDVFLYPINTKYDPIILNKDNPGRILGKAIHVGFDM